MKLKVNDLYNLAIGFNDLADKELSISTSLKIQQNLKSVSEEVVSTDKIRQKIGEKYKEYADDQGRFKPGHADKQDEHNEKIGELMSQDIELNLKKIKLKDLGDISIKPRTLSLLETVLEHDTE